MYYTILICLNELAGPGYIQILTKYANKTI